MSSTHYLTSLARARAWAGITASNDDSLITSLIAEVSQFILNYLGRSAILSKQYTQVMDGEEQTAIILRHWPVTSLSELKISDVTIAQANTANSAGYILEAWDGMPAGFQQKLSLRGYNFSRGVSNVSITYEAGYKVVNEVQTIPAIAPYSISALIPYGNFLNDEGATYLNNTALQKVVTNPTQGQYSISAGIYSFAAADAGADILLNYSFIPSDIEHACVALVAERYRYRSRIGEISKSLGGQESMSYSQRDMPEFVKTLLQPYRRMLPI